VKLPTIRIVPELCGVSHLLRIVGHARPRDMRVPFVWEDGKGRFRESVRLFSGFYQPPRRRRRHGHV